MAAVRKPRLFGTDGIRGAFGKPPLDRPTVTALARGLGGLLATDGRQPRVILGGDTRESTPRIAAWLAAGLAESGVEVRYTGVLPTPGIAWLTRNLAADCGIAVSASHNPYPDNGIKLISREGFKWSPERELDLERRLLERLAKASDRQHDDDGAHEPEAEPALAAAWLDALTATVTGDRPLAGLAVVVDAGHGAASPYAGELLSRLGAEVEILNAAPNGRNVNRGCGSTYPQVAAEAVTAGGFDLGITLDGDADRAILVDEQGVVRDGDAILYLWAKVLGELGSLDPPAIVATSMSNLGLERALAEEGIGVERCAVGDRAVVDTMRAKGILLGGEQSGHIVHLGLSTTGDGLLTAVQLAAHRARAGEPLSSLLAKFRRFPQTLVNVSVSRKVPFSELPQVAAAARQVEESLGDDGRLVLRYSGTEALARIMIEGPDQTEIESLAKGLAAVIEAELR